MNDLVVQMNDDMKLQRQIHSMEAEMNEIETEMKLANSCKKTGDFFEVILKISKSDQVSLK